ncbi:unnamed protein product [Medioppia subpectinata]|uniref:Uncharacterized protein n=1 Tax=Medioppia subpectinata TaxID=1979941 RepID=A0A7R9L514_9ACAR|nr:unnamed protein product [Medioppia subpectinata]CAG2115479.1 unnamed protein product [Medioppia subpectinata]
MEYVRQSCVKRQPFQRSNSLRTSNVNNQRTEEIGGSSISVTPILPITSVQLSSANAISDDERPKSAQENSSHKSNAFPETPPSPSIDGRSDGRPSGWSSTHFMSREGFASPDLMDVEVDDISNDSYLIDKETKSLSNRILMNPLEIM